MRQLISKLIAAAISAGVVLLWWPIIMSTDGPASWALRAIAMTLLFEAVFALLGPIEENIWDNVEAARKLGAKMLNARQRVYENDRSRVARTASRSAVVLLVAAIPLALVVGGPQTKKPAPTVLQGPGTTKIVRITKVVRVKEQVTPATGQQVPRDQQTTRPKRQSPARKPAGRKQASSKQRSSAPERERSSGPTAPVGDPQAGNEGTPLAAAPPSDG